MIQKFINSNNKNIQKKNYNNENTNEFVNEKLPFLADVDEILKQDLKQGEIHPFLEQLIEFIQLHSKSESKDEIEISDFHLNQGLIQFSQSIENLFNTTLFESQNSFQKLYSILYETNQKFEKVFQQKIEEINNEIKTYGRKLQTSLADRSNNIEYEINLLQETLKSTKFNKEEREKQIRRKLRDEYSPQVYELSLQLFSLKQNLENYKKSLRQEIESKMFEIKKQSISQLLQSTNIPEEIKESMKKAFENDDNIHQLMTQRSELSTAVYKLKSIRLLQEISTRNEYQMKLKKIEEQREQIKEEINEFNNEKVIKENAFKEQYQIVMKNVNIAKKEVEKLKRELELENQNKIKLTDWKRKHENKVSILEKKLKKLEKWSKFNPDKLMFELSTLQREIELKRKTKERAPELLEKTKNSINKELSRCKKQLKIHESLKNEYERLANVKPSQTIVDADFVQNENLEDLMEENKKLKEENEKLQQKLAELNLQIAAVSEITVGSKTKIGGLKLKASRLDGTL